MSNSVVIGVSVGVPVAVIVIAVVTVVLVIVIVIKNRGEKNGNSYFEHNYNVRSSYFTLIISPT